MKTTSSERTRMVRKTTIWTKEKTAQVIELYRKHECLWNHYTAAYKSKDRRKQAIEDVCHNLQISKFDFGKKIHNLRNQFNSEMKKLERRMEESGCQPGELTSNNRCRWEHFESLMFLRDVIEPRPAGYQAAATLPLKKMRLKADNSSEDDVDNNQTGAATPNTNRKVREEPSPKPTATPHANNDAASRIVDFQFDENGVAENGLDVTDFQDFDDELAVATTPRERPNDSFDHKYNPTFPTSQACSRTPLATPLPMTALASIPQDMESSSVPLRRGKRPSVVLPASHNPLKQSSTAVAGQAEATVQVQDTKNFPTSSLLEPAPAKADGMPIAVATDRQQEQPSRARDQWDAFGELIASEFRQFNSEQSCKKLKRKIWQAMLEVGEEDDAAATPV